MTCHRIFAVCILIVVNILFLIVGVALVAAGAIIQFGWKLLVNYLEQTLRSVLLPLLTQVPKNQRVDVGEVIQSLSSVLAPLAISLMVIGSFFVLLCVLGIVATCTQNRRLLTLYVTITGIIFGIFIATFIWFLVDKESIKLKLKVPLKKLMNDNYEGTGGNMSIPSVIIDVIHFKLHCCGFDNGSDFNAGHWNRQHNLTVNGHTESVTLLYPISCCKMDRSFQLLEVNCTRQPHAGNSHVHNGCWPYLNSIWLRYEEYLIYAMGGICGTLGFLFILGLESVCSSRKSSVKPV